MPFGSGNGLFNCVWKRSEKRIFVPNEDDIPTSNEPWRGVRHPRRPWPLDRLRDTRIHETALRQQRQSLSPGGAPALMQVSFDSKAG